MLLKSITHLVGVRDKQEPMKVMQPSILASLKMVYPPILNNFHMKSMYKQNILASLSNKAERLLNKLILQLSIIIIRSFYIFAGWGLGEVMSKHMRNDLSS